MAYNNKDEERRKKESREDFQRIVGTITGVLQSMSRRRAAIDDPKIRYALLIDKLCMIVDTMSNFAKYEAHRLELNDHAIEQIDETSSDIQNELNEMIKWISAYDHANDWTVMNAGEDGTTEAEAEAEAEGGYEE